MVRSGKRNPFDVEITQLNVESRKSATSGDSPLRLHFFGFPLVRKRGTLFSFIATLLLGFVLLGLFPLGTASANAGPHGGYTPTTDACAGCHRSHTAGSSALLVQSMPGLCLTCHGSAGTGADTNVEDGVFLERDTVTEVPAEGVSGRGLKGGGFTNALMDSDEDGAAASTGVTSSHEGNLTTMWGNGITGSGPGLTGYDLTCGSCHDPHGNGNYRSLKPIPSGSGASVGVTLSDPVPRNYTVASPVNSYTGENYNELTAQLTSWCSQCHTRYHASYGSGHVDSGDPIFAFRHPTDIVACIKCHVAHGTSATMGSGSGTNVAYPDGSSAGSDDARSSLLRLDDRRICYACHVNPDGTVSGGSCTTCHNQPQGPRRQIVGPGGDFQLASHHVNGSAQDRDCVTCHDISAHQGGTVRLFNVDTLSIVAFSGSGSALEPLCLACHDADGANGSQPFSDSVAPPVIDQIAWNSASHKTSANGPQTCYGSCHANGHGSNKVDLLAPWDASPDASPADPLKEEERFCYDCHDADGPAGTDIQAEFSSPNDYRHNVSSADPGGEFVECTNCHNPHLANGTNRLANPDNPVAAWGGTFEDFCLTCHDGSPPPGISFPASSGTGFDKSSFPGSTHDIQTGGTDSCRQCHEQHGSQYLSILKNNYVVTDYNNYSAGDYQLCWSSGCHTTSAVMNQDNVFGEHDKHVRRERVPCIMCHDAHAPHDGGEPGLISFVYAQAHSSGFSFTMGRNASTAFVISGNKGYCYVRCHGVNHSPKDYNRP